MPVSRRCRGSAYRSPNFWDSVSRRGLSFLGRVQMHKVGKPSSELCRSRTSEGQLRAMGGKTLSEHIFSELLQIADIVESANSHRTDPDRSSVLRFKFT